MNLDLSIIAQQYKNGKEDRKRKAINRRLFVFFLITGGISIQNKHGEKNGGD